MNKSISFIRRGSGRFQIYPVILDRCDALKAIVGRPGPELVASFVEEPISFKRFALGLTGVHACD